MKLVFNMKCFVDTIYMSNFYQKSVVSQEVVFLTYVVCGCNVILCNDAHCLGLINLQHEKEIFSNSQLINRERVACAFSTYFPPTLSENKF
jgi:hypothetical protein